MSLLRRACGVLAAAALVVAVPAGTALAASPTTRASLVFDDARILDDSSVVHDINALRNKAGVKVAVLTTGDDADVHKDTYDDDVLTYLEEHDDKAVLSSDGDGLRDGLILIAVSPDVRQVGVYAGDDVDLDSDGVEEVVAAVRPDARAGRWDDVVVGGAKKALAVTAAGEGTSSDEPDSDDQTYYPTSPENDPTDTTSPVPVGAIVGLVAGVGALIGAPWAVVAARRRRRRRAELLAWTPEPSAVADALRQWRDAIEQVQMTGYPDHPRDRSGRAAWTYDPAASVATLETLASDGPTLAQRVDPAAHARLTALLSPRRTLTAWVDDARFWAREAGWEERWEAELERLVGGPLAAFLGSVDALAGDRPGRRLTKIRTEAEALQASAAALDRSVRAGEVRPTDGLAEARALNRRIRTFAEEAAHTVGRGLSDRAKRNLLAGTSGHDPSLSPYLLGSLIAASASQDVSSGSAGDLFGTPGTGAGGFGASTTFNDSSSSGGGMTGGSGGF
ncbi:DUF5129 domain-containing protein [Microlunatus antarcticus]|uniref:DUF5129 domain-containing protein n=1 Tax=Microlunatus antarcticus TaxID=53388 RepID=A0A7W5JWT7_9ACTN|nr:DUF5129 domain-containing protein [Microlunatus antarcticus]MBB3327521.1 hypothetical protein [Microlunatus antarcticus]